MAQCVLRVKDSKIPTQTFTIETQIQNILVPQVKPATSCKRKHRRRVGITGMAAAKNIEIKYKLIVRATDFTMMRQRRARARRTRRQPVRHRAFSRGRSQVRRHAPVGSLEPRSCTGNLRPPQRTAQSSGLPRLPQLPQYPCRRGARSHGCPRRRHARALYIKARPAHGLLHVHIQLKVGPSTHNECLHFVPFCIRRCHARRSGCGGRCHRGARRHCQRAAHAGPCARRRDRGRRRWGSATRGRAWSHRSRTARVVACAARQELKRPLKPWVSRFRHDASSNKKGPQSIVSVPKKMLVHGASWATSLGAC